MPSFQSVTQDAVLSQVHWGEPQLVADDGRRSLATDGLRRVQIGQGSGAGAKGGGARWIWRALRALLNAAKGRSARFDYRCPERHRGHGPGPIVLMLENYRTNLIPHLGMVEHET